MGAVGSNPFYEWGKEDDYEPGGIPAKEIAFEFDNTVSPELLDNLFYRAMNQMGIIANDPTQVESTVNVLIELWKQYRATLVGLDISNAFVDFAQSYFSPEHEWNNNIHTKRATFNTRKLLTRINDYRNRGFEEEGSFESQNMQIILDGISFLEPLS